VVVEEPLLEDLKGVGRAHALHVEVAGARDNDVPEPVDHGPRLAARVEKLREGPIGPAVPVGRPHPDDAPHGPRNVAPLAPVKQAHLHERPRQVERGRQPARLQLVDLAAGPRPVQRAVPLDVVEHAQPVVEVDEVCAAAQQHVLAVVEELIGAGVDQARGPAPQHLAALDDRRPVAGVRQAHRCGQAGKPATDHGDRFVARRLHV
jgi:hypothetical protein